VKGAKKSSTYDVTHKNIRTPQPKIFFLVQASQLLTRSVAFTRPEKFLCKPRAFLCCFFLQKSLKAAGHQSVENQIWSFWVLWKQCSFIFTTALCLIKLLSSCRMLLDAEPKYGSCNEIDLGEGEGSAGASRCCVTPYFLFKYCWTQWSKNCWRTRCKTTFA